MQIPCGNSQQLVIKRFLKKKPPSGNNFCIKRSVDGHKFSDKCHWSIPSEMATQPRIKYTPVTEICMPKATKNSNTGRAQPFSQTYHFIRKNVLSVKAFTTYSAKRAGNVNACSGQIFVSVSKNHHFRLIQPEHDERRNLGVLVGESW